MYSILIINIFKTIKKSKTYSAAFITVMKYFKMHRVKGTTKEIQEEKNNLSEIKKKNF